MLCFLIWEEVVGAHSNICPLSQELDFWGIHPEQERRTENGFALVDDVDPQKVSQMN